GLAFDVALHFGTLLAVLWYFRLEWLQLIKAAFGIVRTGRIETPEKRRVIYLIVATIPGAIGGYLLQSRAESAFRSPQIITNALMSGVVASAISGWLAISILMRYVSRHSYGIFAVYRVLLGVAVLAVIYFRG